MTVEVERGSAREAAVSDTLASRIAIGESPMRTVWRLCALLRCAVISFALIPLSAGYAAEHQGWPKGVVWAGSALGGAHYIYGGALLKVLAKYLGVSTSLEATGGPWQNVALANAGDAQLVPVPSATLFEAYTGRGKANGRKFSNLRAVLPMFPQYLQWWALPGSGIKAFTDLTGKRVDMSGPGSFLNDYGRRIFAMFNIKPSQITNLSNFNDSNGMLADGQLDAAAAWSGTPAPPAAEMATTRDAVVFGLPKTDAEKFAAKYPGVFPAVIPAGTYKGQSKPIETLALWTFVATNKQVSDDFIYNVVKAAFNHHDEIVQVFKAAKDSLPQNIEFAPIPLQKGAYKYYEENGFKIPDAAKPVD
jgi:uncharacterized protein